MELKIPVSITKIRAVLVNSLFVIAILGFFGVEAFSDPSRTRKIEKHLLSMLGMKNRPLMNRKNLDIPKEIMDLFQKHVNMEFMTPSLDLLGKNTGTANTIRYYFHQPSSVDKRFLYDYKFRLYFNITDFPSFEKLSSAELNITIVPKNENYCTQQIRIYDILQPGVKGKSKPILNLIETLTAEPTTHGATRISLFLLPTVQRWLSDSKNNHGLLIDVKSSTGDKVKFSHARLRRSVSEKEKNWLDTQPVLYLYSIDSKIGSQEVGEIKRKRKSRSSEEIPENYRKNQCRRHKLYVDFEILGWNDWILYPRGYEAFYCAGECPGVLADPLNTTNHAIIQTLMHKMHPTIVPKPCCVPTSLSSLPMLVHDEGPNAKYKIYHNMIADGCGCL